MPELPEVEAICGRLRRQTRNSEILRAHILRPRTTHPQDPSLLESALPGRLIETVARRGKHILLGLSGGHVLRVHLRMTGNLYVIPDARFRPATTRTWIELVGGKALILDDPRALGVLHLFSAAEAAAAIAGLGPEPLSREFTARLLADVAGASRQPVKLFLMDQRHVAGLGNIYAAEALFRAGIHPARPANRIRSARISALHNAIIGVLREAIRSARNSYGRPGSIREAEQFQTAVYDREGQPCIGCGARIHRIQQGGRSTYFCPRCQR